MTNTTHHDMDEESKLDSERSKMLGDAPNDGLTP